MDLPAELGPYEATLQHIALIKSRREKLLATQMEAERQVLHRAARDYHEGRLSPDSLVELYQRYRDLTREDPRLVGALWAEEMPITPSQLKARICPVPPENGTWRGAFPFAGDWRPPNSQSVVYVLFDAALVPCYVGSTQEFNVRLPKHARDGKPFTSWVAHPCAGREAAYELEDRLLKQHKPYLNRKDRR